MSFEPAQRRPRLVRVQDARKAREESKRMYARLAESETARIAAATNLRAAETTNKVTGDARVLLPCKMLAPRGRGQEGGVWEHLLCRKKHTAPTICPLAAQVLTAQLSEVNLSFKSALETAADMLEAISTRPRPRRAAAQAAADVGARGAAESTPGPQAPEASAPRTVPAPDAAGLRPATPAPKPWSKGSAKA